MNGEGPEMEDVVPGESVPLLDHHHLTAQQGQLDGRPQAARATADNQALNGGIGLLLASAYSPYFRGQMVTAQ